MARQDVCRYDRLTPCRNVDQAYDACVPLSTQDRQFTEVLVKRDEHPLLPVRALQDFLVAGVLWPVAGVHDVVSCVDKLLSRSTPDTRVEQESQVSASTTRGSTRSRATSRFA